MALTLVLNSYLGGSLSLTAPPMHTQALCLGHSGNETYKHEVIVL